MSRSSTLATGTTSLKPVLGPVQLIFYSVGVIVGAGVYSVIGSAAGLAHRSLWRSFVVGAGVAMLTALSYAEIGNIVPGSGRRICLSQEGMARCGLARVQRRRDSASWRSGDGSYHGNGIRWLFASLR